MSLRQLKHYDGIVFVFYTLTSDTKVSYGKMPRMFSVEQFDQSFCPSRYSDLAVKRGFHFFLQKNFLVSILR